MSKELSTFPENSYSFEEDKVSEKKKPKRSLTSDVLEYPTTELFGDKRGSNEILLPVLKESTNENLSPASSASNNMLSSSYFRKFRSLSPVLKSSLSYKSPTAHVHGTPSIKRSHSFSENSTCWKSPNNNHFLRFLFQFHTHICISIGCNNEVRDIAWMVRITISEACLKCCIDVTQRAFIRGKRSLPVKREEEESPDRRVSPYSTPTRNTYSSQSSCTPDQTPYSQKRKRPRTVLPYYNPFDLLTFKSEQGFIDAHCHLDFLFQRQGYEGSYSDYQKKHKKTYPESYKGCLAVFCNPHTFKKRELWEKYLGEENVWASFGCHPHNAKDYNDEIEKSLCSALEHPKVRSLGEIGLDYSNRNNCIKSVQHAAFRRQLNIAVKKNLPVVIHCREAHEDGIAIMREIVPKDYLIHLHCFTDTWEWATKWMQEFSNLFIGITNVITFPSAEEVHEVGKKIPLTRLLLETDAPYFIPKQLQRETRYSHPGMAIHVAAQIAALKGGIPLELVLHTARHNTKKMYNI